MWSLSCKPPLFSRKLPNTLFYLYPSGSTGHWKRTPDIASKALMVHLRHRYCSFPVIQHDWHAKGKAWWGDSPWHLCWRWEFNKKIILKDNYAVCKSRCWLWASIQIRDLAPGIHKSLDNLNQQGNIISLTCHYYQFPETLSNQKLFQSIFFQCLLWNMNIKYM